jgi:hypothetical protein
MVGWTGKEVDLDFTCSLMLSTKRTELMRRILRWMARTVACLGARGGFFRPTMSFTTSITLGPLPAPSSPTSHSVGSDDVLITLPDSPTPVSTRRYCPWKVLNASSSLLDLGSCPCPQP